MNNEHTLSNNTKIINILLSCLTELNNIQHSTPCSTPSSTPSSTPYSSPQPQKLSPPPQKLSPPPQKLCSCKLEFCVPGTCKCITCIFHNKNTCSKCHIIESIKNKNICFMCDKKKL